jgi:arylsulfatase A-like enzyme
VVQPATGNSKKQHGAWNMPEQYHMNVWIAERTNALIDAYWAKNEKFFIWASFFDPHPPYLLPEPWASMYKPEDMRVPETAYQDLGDMPLHYRITKIQDKVDKAQWQDAAEPFQVHGLGPHRINEKSIKANLAYYYGMISFMDHYIGKILDKLEQSGLLDNTLVIFTTDYGHLLGQHGLTAKGVFDYEDAVRIPFCAAYKGHIPAGRRTGSLLSLIDLAPTLLSYAGLPAGDCMNGVDQKEVWNGKADKARDHVIVENRFQPTKFYVRTYIGERYKIAYDMNSDEGELFDLESDPGEMRNLWDDPAYKELKTLLLLRALQADMRAEPGMPRIAGA